MAEELNNEVTDEPTPDVEEEVLEVDETETEPETEPESEGDGPSEEESKSQEPSMSKEDEEFLGLKKTGLSAAQIRSLAHKGWQAEKDEREKSKTKKGGEDDDENSEEYLPVTKKEMKEQMDRHQVEMRNESAAMMMQAKVDVLLDSDRDASSDSITRSMIEGAVWKGIQDGKTVTESFKDGKKQWKEYVSRANKAYVKSKVSARSSPGSPSSSTMSDVAPPEDMKHSADDFSTGKALDDAVAYARKIDASAFR